MSRHLNYVRIEDVLYNEGCFIDLRSESEYADDHIPGALNIPLLVDAHRHEVGILHKFEGPEIAKMQGFRMFLGRFEIFMKAIREAYETHGCLYLYCWRGGSRSEYVLDMLLNMGFVHIYKVLGGYKKYRNYLLSELPKLCVQKQAIVLHGFTGAGKTDLLQLLKNAGYPILCLESLAQNSGSVFGNVFFRDPPPSQKYFESMLFDELTQLKTKTFFVESESRRVGTVSVPEVVMASIQSGIHVLVSTDIEIRIGNLYRNYVACGGSESFIRQALDKLRKRLGHNEVDMLLAYLEQGEFLEIIRVLLIDYYDPLYKYSIDQYTYDAVVDYQTYDEAILQLKTIQENAERTYS